MKYNIVKLFMLELISSSSGYNMVKVDPGFVSVAPGETTRLLCGTDGHWEYCKWYSPGGQDCDFEWKRMTNSVEKQACSLGNHVEFTGEYNDKECGIIINTVQDADAGLWICHIEEYVFLGGQGSGRNVEAKINVTVQAPTTVPPSTTSATTPTTTTVTTPLTTTATSAVTSTLSWNDDDIHSSVVHSGHTEDKNATTDVHTTSTTDVHATSATTDVHATSATTDVYKQDAADIDEESIIPGYSDTPSAVPRIEEVDSTIPAVVGVVCALVLVGSIIAGFLLVRRRRRGPDAGAAVVYDAAARAVHDQRTMVNGQRPAEMSYQENNYHEYFPPSLAGSSPESQA